LLAVSVSVYIPPLPDAGVPLSVAVPFPLFTNVTPLGSVPVSVNVGVGDPVVVTVKLPAVPTVKVVLFPLVIAGAWFTVNVKVCVAALPTPLLAVSVSVYIPPLPDAGVPLSVAVPFPLFTNVTPLGSVPVSVNVGVGDPVVVTVKLPAVPTVNVVLLALVIAGAICVAAPPNATIPRITLSVVVAVPKVPLCAPAATPTLYSISCPTVPT
jgi:hypothetical protein